MIILKRLNELLDECNGMEDPKITIALPTHRRVPENKQDLIRYGNLLKDIKANLEGYPLEVWETAYARLTELKDDIKFWNNAMDGMVIMACGDHLETFLLNYPVEDVAIVGEAFHVMPLFLKDRIYDDFYLVGLAKDRHSIFEAGPGGVAEVEFESIKSSFDELFEDVDSNKNYNTATYSGVTGSAHGHREKSGEEDKYREKYFRYLDKEFQNLAAESGMKFILAGTPENLTAFKNFAQGKIYLEKMISKPLSSLDNGAMLEEVEKVLLPEYEAVLNEIKERIGAAISAGKVLYDFNDISKAADEGRVAELIVTTGDVYQANPDLDILISQVLKTGGSLAILGTDSGLENVLTALIRY